MGTTFALNHDFNFIRDCDKEAGQPIFVIKTLKMSERVMLSGAMTGLNETNLVERFSDLMDACELGVREIRGASVPVGESVRDLLESCRDVALIVELVQAIFNHNFPTKEMEKNSHLPREPVRQESGAEIVPTTATAPKGATKRSR